MDFLLHSTDFVGLYNIINEGKMKTANRLGIRGTTGENKDIIYFTPISSEYVEQLQLDIKPNRFLIILKPNILNTYNKFFINAANAFGPLSGKSRKGNCTCKYTFYSDEFKRDFEPASKDCFIEGIEDMNKILSEEFPPTNNIYDYCDGGPEVGIFPPDGEINILPYIYKIIYPSKDKLSAYYKSRIESNIGLDKFYTVVSKSILGGGGRRRKTAAYRRCRRTLKLKR